MGRTPRITQITTDELLGRSPNWTANSFGSAAGTGDSWGWSGAVACQTSLTRTCSAPAVGMASSAATKPPDMPPIRLPIEAPVSTAMKTSSGLIRTVLLMMTGFRTWFSIWV
jgi:hypothetical protein